MNFLSPVALSLKSMIKMVQKVKNQEYRVTYVSEVFSEAITRSRGYMTTFSFTKIKSNMQIPLKVTKIFFVTSIMASQCMYCWHELELDSTNTNE